MARVSLLPSSIEATNSEFNSQQNSTNEPRLTGPVRRSSKDFRNLGVASTILLLNELSDDEFVETVEECIHDCRLLNLENEVMMEFLKDCDPIVIEDMPKVNAAIKELEANPTLETPYKVLFSDDGVRLNISSLQDIVMRYVEEIKRGLHAFEKKIDKEKRKLKVIIEEATLRIDEVVDATEVFENTMKQSQDPITQRIPGEKFQWYMKEWMKNARVFTEKLRLGNLSLKGEWRKAKATLKRKENIRILCPADFGHLQIHNKSLQTQFKESSRNLMELEHVLSEIILSLSRYKSYLFMLAGTIKTLHENIAQCEKKTESFSRELESMEKKTFKVKRLYNKIHELATTCKVCSPIEYLRVKAHLFELQKAGKILDHKARVQARTLMKNKRLLMQVSREKVFQKKWLKPLKPDVDDEVAGLSDSNSSHKDLIKFDELMEATKTNDLPKKKSTKFDNLRESE